MFTAFFVVGIVHTQIRMTQHIKQLEREIEKLREMHKRHTRKESPYKEHKSVIESQERQVF